MRVIDLDRQHESLFCVCLEDWSDEVKEGEALKKDWYSQMKKRGLRVKLAVDENGQVGGMIQYAPVEYAPAKGNDSFFIYCIWVHGHKKGRGNFQKKGMGKALLKAAEQDAQSKGAKAMIAWGLSSPFWMKASWFLKQGYVKTDQDGSRVLVWKPFSADAVAPKWIRQVKKPAAGAHPGKVTVTSFVNGFCPAQNMVAERAKRATAEIGDKAIFQQIHTLDRDVFLAWGISDALYIEDKAVNTGPPPSYERILK